MLIHKYKLQSDSCYRESVTPVGVLSEDSTLFLYKSFAGTGNAKTVLGPCYKIL